MRYRQTHHSLRGGRPTNQDRTVVAERHNAVLMVVADGLGGHVGGEIAAETLTASMVRAFQQVRTPLIERPSAFLALAILQAHNAIVARGNAHNPPLEPRTTCVACLVQDGYAYWAHVGDSRLYHFRGGKLITRTQDHTSIERLRESGLLTDAEMQDHPQKARLLKCVGGPNRPSVSLGEETKLYRGDVLLLVSDGVWEALAGEEIAGFVAHADLEEGIEELLLATQRKMRQHCDNISAAALRWEDAATLSLPRQGNRPVEIDKEQMWREAQRPRSLARPTPPATAPAAATPANPRRSSIEDTIEDLESFLRSREPKPREP